MRICVVNNILHEESEAAAHQTLLEGCAAGMLRADTAIRIHGLAQAPPTAQTAPACYRDPFFQLLSTLQIVRAVVVAEREGFDAAVVNCFDDYGVHEARSLVDIPVLGIGATSLGFAAALAAPIGLIVPNLPGQIEYATRQIAALGLSGALLPGGIRHDALPFAESWQQCLAEPGCAIERFEPLARSLVQDGAACVVFGCGGFSLVCGAQGFTAVEVAGQAYPVVVPITVTLQYAEEQVLRRREGLPGDPPLPGAMRHDRATLARLLSDFGLPSFD
jgi:Asp/Glu/hydantoin racemase